MWLNLCLLVVYKPGRMFVKPWPCEQSSSILIEEFYKFLTTSAYFLETRLLYLKPYREYCIETLVTGTTPFDMNGPIKAFYAMKGGTKKDQI
jgi:hypothetical protein